MKVSGRVPKPPGLVPRLPRPKAPEPAPLPLAPPAAEPPGITIELSEVLPGVPAAWLARVFGLELPEVRSRLLECPFTVRGRQGNLYDLKEAAKYLVKPKEDLHKYLERMKPNELPEQLRKAFWEARLSRQKYEVNAGDLWRTVDVIEVMGEVFKTIKTTTQLWADNLELSTGITEQQRNEVLKMVDALHTQLHQNLIKLRQERQTPSSLAEGD